MSGEEAFLASLGTGEPAEQVVDDNEPQSDEEDYDPTGSDDKGSASEAYDPLAPVVALSDEPLETLAPPSQAVSRSATHTPAVSTPLPTKPVTIGGFVTEDSDEEGEATQTSGAVALETVKSPSQAPVSNSPAPPMAQQSAASLSVPVPANGVSPSPAPTPANGASAPVPVSISKTRLPNDIVGIFEDRIAEDPKGDSEAWMGLIAHLRSKAKYDEVRKVYARFFEVFPTAGDQWIAYARLEQQLDDQPRLEAIFNQALLKVQSIELWSIYIDHVRRRNDIITDASGQGRQVVSQAYEFVINQVGQDKDSGQLWQDYINFIKSGPGVAGGTGWQDAQKMDLLRKAYQRAVCVPMSSVSQLWKEYDSFEMGLNKMTGRKFLQEKSPSYMTARSSYTSLYNITVNLRRGMTPRLPPHPGCAGEEDFNAQLDAWQKWVAWEKEDPLVLKDEDINAMRQRILFVYRQATMALRFYPQIWFDAAEWCFTNELEADGTSFLDQGLEANPESCLLAFKKADRIEQTMSAEEGEDSMVKWGDAVRAPYDIVLDTLYSVHDKVEAREKLEVAKIEQRYAEMSPESREGSPVAAVESYDADGEAIAPPTRTARKEKEIADVKVDYESQLTLIKRCITFAWIGLMRAMRRIQGKGRPGEKIGGMRGVFKDARFRGRLLSDCHVATALMEHNCYKDPAASRIFNLGTKLFPADEKFALAHMKFLISLGDSTNARVVFETTVAKIFSTTPQQAHRAKILFAFFYDWESKYGELSQAVKIEKRLAELYPDDPALALFSARFASNNFDPPPFDPCTVNLVISPSQIRPTTAAPQIVTSIETAEAPMQVQSSYIQSPKRGLDESDAELPARKMLRGESPLKGAAGRRQQQRQAREGLVTQAVPAGPKPLPGGIQSLLSVIPPARAWDQTRFDPARMVELIRQVDLTKARLPANVGPQQTSYGYGR